MSKLYAKWMYGWETHLTTLDSNRVVRPLEWGIEWTRNWKGLEDRFPADPAALTDAQAEAHFNQLNRVILNDSDAFFSYDKPADFRLEERFPELFPTNKRQTQQVEELRRKQESGELKKASFLRFTSPVRTPYPENDVVNARWFPAPRSKEKRQSKPKQAIIVMPQWNADAFSHNALCALFNRFGISALRLSKPYHDIRRPAELERSDYAVSANIGRTIDSCRQAIIDIRCCLDWLEAQGYEQFGVLGTSLGSCYAFMAAAHDPRLRVCAFNHGSTYFGDVVWTGQSTRHIRAAFEPILDQERLRQLWLSISPMVYMDKFAANPKRVLLIYSRYDLTFLEQFSKQVLVEFGKRGVDFVAKVLPCGHYTTGEFPFKYLDGWYLGSFVYSAFKRLAREAVKAPDFSGCGKTQLQEFSRAYDQASFRDARAPKGAEEGSPGRKPWVG